MSDELNSFEFTDDAFFTQNFPFSGMYFSHGSAFIFSKSSSNVTALNSETLIRTLSAVLKNIFAFAIPLSSDSNVTLPSSVFIMLNPSCVSSFFSTASSPK